MRRCDPVWAFQKQYGMEPSRQPARHARHVLNGVHVPGDSVIGPVRGLDMEELMLGE